MASLGFSVSDFLSPAQPDPSCVLDRFQQLDIDSMVVSGHSTSAKASLLLHAAWTYACRGQTVYFVSNRVRMHKDSLMLPLGVTGGDPALARIGMRYLTGREQFIKLAAALPMIPAPSAPDVFILDDAGDLLSETKAQFRRERSICSSMAVLMAGLESLSRRHCKRVRLLLGVPHASECPIYVFWRFVPAAIELHQESGTEADVRYLKLRAGPRMHIPAEQQALRAWYRIHGDSLTCCGVTP